MCTAVFAGKLGHVHCLELKRNGNRKTLATFDESVQDTRMMQAKTGDSENWYSLKKKEEHAQGFIEVMRKYTTNMTDENIRNIYVSTPAEYSMKFMDMKRGSIKQGAYLPLQMGFMRPNEFCSKHRSPIKGLYMGGACTYPGGTILLANGYLAADAVADELGLDRWWEEPEIVKNAREKGLL